MRVRVPDTDAVLADAMAEQADVRRLTGTHAHADECAFDLCVASMPSIDPLARLAESWSLCTDLRR